MFYIWTTPANLKIQLKPSMSEICNYLIANPIFFDRMRIEEKEFFFFGRENVNFRILSQEKGIMITINFERIEHTHCRVYINKANS